MSAERKWINDYLSSVQAIIDDHGWMLQGVFPTNDDPGGPTWVYTVGLFQWGHPELCLVGLPYKVAATVLNDMGDRIRDKGESFRPGDYSDKVLTGANGEVMTMAFLRIPDDLYGEWFGVARRYYRTKALSLTVVQGIWPDTQNRLPWDSDFEAKFKERQVMLGVREGGG